MRPLAPDRRVVRASACRPARACRRSRCSPASWPSPGRWPMPGWPGSLGAGHAADRRSPSPPWCAMPGRMLLGAPRPPSRARRSPCPRPSPAALLRRGRRLHRPRDHRGPARPTCSPPPPSQIGSRRDEPSQWSRQRRVPPTSCPTAAEELARRRVPAGAGRRPRRRGRGCGSCTCSSPAGPIAASSSNVVVPADDPSRAVPGRICRSRPAASNARCWTCTASRPIGHPTAAPPGPPRALARGLASDARRRRGPHRPSRPTGRFPFLTVEGTGVYEIPVGPVHAGLIEPGHFRFSVVGETILQLKARLWFVHRGIEKLFQGRTPPTPSSSPNGSAATPPSAHALAYCLAVEDALGIDCARRRAPAAGPAGRTGTALQPRHRHRRAVQRRRHSPWPTPTPSASANNSCGSTTPSPATGCCAAPSSPAASRCARCPTRRELRGDRGRHRPRSPS